MAKLALIWFLLFWILRSDAASYLLIDKKLIDSENFVDRLIESEWIEIDRGEDHMLCRQDSQKSSYRALGFIETETADYVAIYDLHALRTSIVMSGTGLPNLDHSHTSGATRGTVVLKMAPGEKVGDLVAALETLGTEDFVVVEGHLDLILLAGDLSMLNLPGVEENVVSFSLPPVHSVLTLSEIAERLDTANPVNASEILKSTDD